MSNSARLAVALIIVLMSGESLATLRVSGRVVDENQRPVIGAKVVVSNPSPPLRKAIPVLSATGAFAADLSFTGLKLNAEISAPSYVTARKVIIIADSVADVGTVILQRDTSVSVEAVTHLVTPNGDRQNLDIVLVNDRTKPVEVTSIGVDARRKLKSECADPKPGVIFNLKQQPKDVWTAELTSQDKSEHGKWTDAFPVAVRLETSGCENAHLQFTLPYSFALAPAEHAKVRLTLPRRVGTPAVAAELEKWESVVFSLSLSDGTAVDRPWKR